MAEKDSNVRIDYHNITEGKSPCYSQLRYEIEGGRIRLVVE